MSIMHRMHSGRNGYRKQRQIPRSRCLVQVPSIPTSCHAPPHEPMPHLMSPWSKPCFNDTCLACHFIKRLSTAVFVYDGAVITLAWLKSISPRSWCKVPCCLVVLFFGKRTIGCKVKVGGIYFQLFICATNIYIYMCVCDMLQLKINTYTSTIIQ